MAGDERASEQDQVTATLERARDNRQALDEVLPIVYRELKALSAKMLRGENRAGSLQTTILVNEAYLRLVDQTRATWQDRAHFFGVAALAIRRVLVDHARARSAAKRGGNAAHIGVVVSDTGIFADPSAKPPSDAPGIDLEALDRALSELARLDERQGKVVELRFFCGLTFEEAASVLGVSERTVKNDWQFARAWLRDRLQRFG